MNNFQERLNDLLMENNLSRLQLAKTLNISSTTINGYFNRDYYPQIDIAIKIANYFKCSLDYLFGLDDNEVNTNNNDKTFMDNLNFLLKDRKVTIAKAMRDMNMSEYNYYRWKAGLYPKTINLLELVKYFDTSLDFLIGNTNKS